MKIKKLEWTLVGDKYFASCPLFGELEINDNNAGWHCIRSIDNCYLGASKYLSPQHCMAAIERQRISVIKECLNG